MSRLQRIVLPLLGFAGLVVTWQVAASSVSPELSTMFPAPGEVAIALADLAASGALAQHVSASLVRFLVGYLLALAVAVPLGFVFGSAPRLWFAFDPLVQVLRPISPIAWFPLFSLWFGIGELPALVIIFMAAFYPALLATIAAVRSVDPVYLKVARNFGTSRLATQFGVVLPAALPGIASGARLAIGAAWIFLVAGEMLGVQTGLGFLIIDARNGLATEIVIACIVVIGVLGFILDRLVRICEARLIAAWKGV